MVPSNSPSFHKYKNDETKSNYHNPKVGRS